MTEKDRLNKIVEELIDVMNNNEVSVKDASIITSLFLANIVQNIMKDEASIIGLNIIKEMALNFIKEESEKCGH